MPRPRKHKRAKFLIALAVILTGGGGIGFKFLGKKDDAIPIQVEKVTRRDLTEIVVASGRIQPVVQVVISPEVAGEIVELPVEEGQRVKKGDLLVQIKPDNYQASRNSAEANYKFALGSRSQAEAEMEKAEADFKRNEELFNKKLVPANIFMDFKTLREVAKLRLANSIHQADQAKYALDRATDDLAKTTIRSPIDGTVTKLKSQLGERVLGTSFNMGTEMMTIAELENMEARVDVGEVDVVLIEVGQNVRLEVDAFRDLTFKGTVSAIANASKSLSANPLAQTSNQEPPKFEVRVRILDKEHFRPGMSVTAEIETRSRKDVLTVPIQSVTTRLPKTTEAPNAGTPSRPADEPTKRKEVVFVREGNRVKMTPVKTGISDNDYFEIIEGLSEGKEVVSGGYRAISTALEDGKLVKIGAEPPPSRPGP